MRMTACFYSMQLVNVTLEKGNKLQLLRDTIGGAALFILISSRQT
jgi:hypothetical protein